MKKLAVLLFSGCFLVASSGCSSMQKKDIGTVAPQETVRIVNTPNTYIQTFCGGTILYKMEDEARRDMLAAEQLEMYNNSKDGGTTLRELTDSERHKLYIKADADCNSYINPIEAKNAYIERKKVLENSRAGTKETEESLQHLK